MAQAYYISSTDGSNVIAQNLTENPQNSTTEFSWNTINFTNNDNSTSSSGSCSDLNVPDIILLVFNLLIGCVGLMGNTFIIVVIVSMTSLYKQLANVFVINQIVIDAVSSLCVLTQVASSMTAPPRLIDGQAASEVYCRLWQAQTLMWSLFTSSTYNLVALTLERYLKIVYPVVHKTFFTLRKATLAVAFVWVFGFIFQITTTVPTSAVIGGACWPVGVWPNVTLQLTAGYIAITIQYWLPISVFVVCYTRMIRVLRRVGPHCPPENPNSIKARAQRSLTKTVIMASVGFFFCWSWNEWYYFAFNVGYPISFDGPFYDFSVVMVSLHCCINPFIYAINYDQFRAAIRKIFVRKCGTCAVATDE